MSNAEAIKNVLMKRIEHEWDIKELRKVPLDRMMEMSNWAPEIIAAAALAYADSLMPVPDYRAAIEEIYKHFTKHPLSWTYEGGEIKRAINGILHEKGIELK